MSDNKTVPHDGSVTEFLSSVDNDRRREDAFALLKIMQEETGEEAVLWGPSIVGFGSYHYRYASGREGDFLATGFSPRKQNLVVYVMSGFDGFAELMGRLGRHKTGKSCLYLNRLGDVNEEVLRELIRRSVAHVKSRYPEG